MDTDDTTLPDSTLGYSYNQGGLNNQKLALYGLFFKAFRDGPRRIILPDLLLFDQVSFNHLPVPLDHVLQPAPLREFAARHEIEVLDSPPRGGKEAGWDYFHYGNNDIPRAALLSELGVDSFACDFFRALVPSPRISDLSHRLTDAAFGQQSIRLAVQLRIERDWAPHTNTRLRPNVGETEENDLSFKDILAKVANTLPADASRIYAICDEAALPVPKEEIRQAVQREFSIELVWKSDLLDEAELNGLSLLDRSILDFEMAIAAELFVGLTRSTFSNMVVLEKYARTRAPVERHYIYNVIGPHLALRRDNGAFSVPAVAAAPNPWDPAHSFHLAQIFQAAGDQHRALEQYAARAARGGPELEEIYISLYRAAQIKAGLGRPVADVIDTYLRAADILPSRAEALHGASRHARVSNMFKEGYEIAKRGIDLPPPAEGLFVEPWIYDWAMLDEYAVNAYHTRHYRESLSACIQILTRKTSPENHRDRIVNNARFFSIGCRESQTLAHWETRESMTKCGASKAGLMFA